MTVENIFFSFFFLLQNGKRITTRVVLSGAVLGVWDRVETQLRGGEDGGQVIRMKVCRLRGSNGMANTIGILVPNECEDELSRELGVDADYIENLNSDETAPKVEPKDETKLLVVKSEIETKIEAEIEAKIEPKIESKNETKIELKSEYDTDVEFVC